MTNEEMSNVLFELLKLINSRQFAAPEMRDFWEAAMRRTIREALLEIPATLTPAEKARKLPID